MRPQALFYHSVQSSHRSNTQPYKHTHTRTQPRYEYTALNLPQPLNNFLLPFKLRQKKKIRTATEPISIKFRPHTHSGAGATLCRAAAVPSRSVHILLSSFAKNAWDNFISTCRSAFQREAYSHIYTYRDIQSVKPQCAPPDCNTLNGELCTKTKVARIISHSTFLQLLLSKSIQFYLDLIIISIKTFLLT